MGEFSVDLGRRQILRGSAVLLALAGCESLGLRTLGAAPALTAAGDTAEGAWETLGVSVASDSDIILTVPGLTENGAKVPISIESRLPDTHEIVIMIEKNPIPLAVRFTIPEGTDPWVSTRIRMAESGRVSAIVEAGVKLYAVSKDTKVTVGGCG